MRPLRGESFEPKAQSAPDRCTPGRGHLPPPALSGGGAAIDDQGAVRRRASFPSPAAPYGRCEDCGDPLSLGLVGTFCDPCEVECPGCGEPECHASCAARAGQTAAARRRVAERRVPSGRIAAEASRQHARAVWSLSGARA
ncbi:hypothetical protein [Miltoncostaea marina]|uniref:hypothetical protein n=1 Tax=Miltoncostaea marina TaxID=2843215 RepID=UPI001C3E6364|nr:hypothetical protein [Miltoncostaea marina]